MDVVRTSTSWHDQRSIVDHFVDLDAFAAAERFLACLDDTLQFIAQFPDLGSPTELPNPRYRNVRFHLIKGFAGYLVVYRAEPTNVTILRILHGSQEFDVLPR